MIHDSRTRGEHNVPELTRRQELDDPFLEVDYADVVAWGYNASFIDTIRPISGFSCLHRAWR